MTKYYKIPFGSAGDRDAIPATDGAGAVNYTDGYGIDYSLPLDTDPDALVIERGKFNQLMFDVTTNIQQYQQIGAPDFITNADNGGVDYPYAKGAMVRYSGATYMSLTGSNTALPTVAASWIEISNLIAASQSVMNNAIVGVANAWTFAASVTMAAPGTGNMRINNASPAAATAIAISALAADTGNPDIGDFIATWSDSTHTPRGFIRVEKDASNFVIFGVNGALTDNGTWLQIPVVWVAGAGSFTAADLLYTQFTASGNDGNVASVAMTGDNVIFETAVTGSPITTSGTLVPVLKTQTANRVLAGPATGAAAAPTFRALVPDDVPTVDLTKLATQAANSILANITAGVAVPTAVALAVNQFLARSSTGQIAAKTITDFGLSVVASANAAALLSALGIVITPGTSGRIAVGGVTIQWGVSTAGATTGTINFSTPFGGVPWAIVPGSNYIANISYDITIPTRSAGSFTYYTQTGGTYTFTYIAIGPT